MRMFRKRRGPDWLLDWGKARLLPSLNRKRVKTLLRLLRRNSILTPDQWRMLNELMERSIIVPRHNGKNIYVPVPEAGNPSRGYWIREDADFVGA